MQESAIFHFTFPVATNEQLAGADDWVALTSTKN